MKLNTVYETGELQCERRISVGSNMPAMHIHDVYEIYMALCSDVQVFVNDRIYALEEGDVMLFSHMDLHRVSVPPQCLYERYVLTFSPQILPAQDRAQLLSCFDEARDYRLRMTAAEQQAFIAMLDTLAEEKQQPDFSLLGQRLALEQILLYLCRLRRSETALPPSAPGTPDQRVHAVITYINANYSQPLSLEELAGVCFLNKHYLCRLFRQETGFCIHDYLVYRRLSAALALLRAGESVSAAARLSGFKSDSFFITTFKKHLGDTPYRYIRRQSDFPSC